MRIQHVAGGRSESAAHAGRAHRPGHRENYEAGAVCAAAMPRAHRELPRIQPRAVLELPLGAPARHTLSGPHLRLAHSSWPAGRHGRSDCCESAKDADASAPRSRAETSAALRPWLRAGGAACALRALPSAMPQRHGPPARPAPARQPIATATSTDVPTAGRARVGRRCLAAREHAHARRTHTPTLAHAAHDAHPRPHRFPRA